MEDEKKKTQEKIAEETGKEVSLDHEYKRAYVPTKKELYYYELAYDYIPHVNLRRLSTERAMKKGAVIWEYLPNEVVGIRRDVIHRKSYTKHNNKQGIGSLYFTFNVTFFRMIF